MIGASLADGSFIRRRKGLIVVAIGFSSFYLAGCATTSSEALASSSLSDPLAKCADEVAAAWREARGTTAGGCDWAAVATLEDARSVQSAALRLHFGNAPRVGYKMTFTSDGHTVGEYRAGMLLQSDQSISKAAVSRTFPEADMLFRVKDGRINEAQSLDEVLKYIDAVLPFVEVSNPIVRPEGGRSVINWTATNASVGSGAIGQPFPIDFSQPESLRKFMAMKVTLTDPTGAIVRESGVADDFLPGLVVLRDEVRARGQLLRAGDLLSVGTFGRPVTGDVSVGTYTVTYLDLAGAPLSATAVITP